MRRPRGMFRSARGIRDALIFAGGFLGIIYETLVEKADRPTLLILFASMIGLPAFLRSDELFGAGKRASSRDEKEPHDPSE